MPLSAFLLMLTPLAAEEVPVEASACGTFPAAVRNTSIYGGMSDCYLSEIGEKPLWRDLPDDHIQTLRFTFVHGHSLFFRSVRIETLPDGRGKMVVDGTNQRRTVRQKSKRIGPRTIRLSAEEIAEIDRLVAESGTFDYEVGSWDNTSGDTIYMHCQTLDLERADENGYRTSSVNIGCNRPKKLMPLVDEIVRLAGLEQVGDGSRFYF
jgi:hypothetical protein